MGFDHRAPINPAIIVTGLEHTSVTMLIKLRAKRTYTHVRLPGSIIKKLYWFPTINGPHLKPVGDQ